MSKENTLMMAKLLLLQLLDDVWMMEWINQTQNKAKMENIYSMRTYMLTPCTTVLEKLMVTQLVKKYLPFNYHIHKSPPMDPIWIKLNPVHTLTLLFL
jgi:hypothetical protein